MRPRLPLVAVLCAALAVGSVAVAAPSSVRPSSLGARSTAPPPTPVGPSGSPSPFPTALDTPKPSDEPPDLSAAAGVLQDLDTGQVLFRKSPRSRRPIASLTKIMTALVVLERAGLDDRVEVSDRAASETGSVLGLQAGERITVRNLLYALMLQSSNDAAVALAEQVSGSVHGFVDLMNRRARALHLGDSHFESPHGLDDRGHSSAVDLAALTRAAYLDPTFEAIVRTRVRNIPAPGGPPRHIQSRNALLWLYPDAIGVKTGFTSAAGYSLVATAARDGRRLVAVILGEPREAFNDGAALLDYGFTAFVRATLVRRGQPLGSLDVQGRPVPVVAGEEVVALVRRRDLDDVRPRLVPAEGVRGAIIPGQTVGSVVVRVGKRTVGTARALAAHGLDAPAFWELPPEDLAPAGRSAQVLVVLIRALAGAFL